MQVYHGSSVVVEKPELAKGKRSNDYGQGFYCTEDLEMAKEWACKADEVPWDEYHGRYVSRDTAARQEWREVLKKGAAASLGVFAYDVVRMGLRQGDERIRELLPA